MTIAATGTIISLAISTKLHSPPPPLALELLAASQTYLGLFLSILLWIYAPVFGDNVDCNPFVIFTVLWKPIPALPNGRWTAIVVLGTLTLLYTKFLVFKYLDGRRSRLSATRGDVEGEPKPPSGASSARYRRWLIAGIVASVMTFVFFVLSTELYCRANFSGRSQKWDFGQVRKFEL